MRYSRIWACIHTLASILACGLFLGCGTVIIHPTPTVKRSTLAPTLIRVVPTVQPTKGITPAPSATPSTAKISFTGEDLQFWANANVITGLVVTDEAIWAATGGGVVRWGRDGTPTAFTVRDGLAPRMVRGIAQDGEGHIWVGYEGVRTWSMFDGQAWQTFDDRERAVEAHYEALLAAPAFDPRLWVTRPGGRWVWLPRGDGRIEAYDGSRWRIYGAQHGVRNGSWMVVVSPKGQVWAVGEGVSTAEEGDLWWDDHDYFSEIASPQEITGAVVDAEGALWVSFAAPTNLQGRESGPAGAVGGVARYNLALNRWEGYLANLTETIPQRVYDVRIAPDGTMWLAGEGSVVVRQPSRPWRAFEVPGLKVRAVAQDAAGTLWLGTARGLWALDPENGVLKGPWEVPSPLIGTEVRGVAIDGTGRLLVATDGGATLVTPSGEIQTLTQEAVLSLTSAPQGPLWFSTESGLYRVGEGNAAVRESTQAAAALAVDPWGSLWFCTLEGEILRYGRLQPERRGNILSLAGELPRRMAVDRQGTVWFAFSRGLGQWTADGQWVLIGVEPLLSADVRDVTVGGDDALWVATAKGLARRLPSGRWTRFTVESTGGGLLSMDVRALYAAVDGTVWIATTGGVSRRDAAGNWANFPLAGAEHLVWDGQEALWVTSKAGLYRLRTRALTLVP